MSAVRSVFASSTATARCWPASATYSWSAFGEMAMSATEPRNDAVAVTRFVPRSIATTPSLVAT